MKKLTMTTILLCALCASMSGCIDDSMAADSSAEESAQRQLTTNCEYGAVIYLYPGYEIPPTESECEPLRYHSLESAFTNSPPRGGWTAVVVGD